MTIVIAIKINEGIVMTSDSATAIFPEGKFDNIYYNRKKLFNLIKGLPIGIVTFGDGEIGHLTIPLLVYSDINVKYLYTNFIYNLTHFSLN